jgi:hypothetical protein
MLKSKEKNRIRSKSRKQYNAGATARLPGLDIEIIHRRSLNGETEQFSIKRMWPQWLKHRFATRRQPL